MALVSFHPTELRRQAFRRIVAHRLFVAMLERQGTDVAAECRPESEAAFFAAMRTCTSCPHGVACRLWLELDRPGAGHPSFCPNGRYFDACRAGADATSLRH